MTDIIVSAVGTAGGSGPGLTAEILDQAMKVAIVKAMNEGVTNPEEIRCRIIEARDELVKQYESS